jgi:2-(1,2-epoxy-1,2-dihydrophenyl)acetyl-CoA isomerase
MFTIYATSGGGIVIQEADINQTVVNGGKQNDTPHSRLNEESNKPVARSNSPVLYERNGATALITLNRPALLNAIDMDMAALLKICLQKAGQDQRVRAVILTGAGRGFCAGGDLRFAVAANPEQPGESFLALTKVLHAVIAEIRDMPKPVIAAINGPAAGAGFFLSLTCDLRVMAEGAYLKQSNTSYGLSIPAGGTFLLPRLVGLGRALEIAMLDEPITAARALELGLVTKIVPDALVVVAARQMAEQVGQRSSDALARTKQLMNSAFYHTLEEHLHLARQAIAASANSPEGREGLAAFLEKRQPNFTNIIRTYQV